jgi:hypothetical protein
MDEAGDASNAEIRHVGYFSLEPVSLSPQVRNLAESSFLGGQRESGGRTLAVPNGLSLRTGATAMPN